MISGHMVSISVSVSMVSTSLMSLVCSNVSVLSLLWVSEVKPDITKPSHYPLRQILGKNKTKISNLLSVSSQR